MPLRCLDSTGQSIHSFDFSYDEWQALTCENREVRHLRMPCCASKVTLKKSPRGTRFFAHKAVGSCTTAPETEAHLHLKGMTVIAARANGWTADTEVTGATPSGEQWKADVLARKGSRKVAVEIQWSGQTNDETLRRQERYKESEIRGLWLLRQPGFPITHDLPAICVGGSFKDGFRALIPSHSHMNARDRSHQDRWGQSMRMDEFLNAVFSGRFRFGLPLNIDAIVSVWGTEMICWSCRVETGVVTRIEVNSGPSICHFSMSDLGEHPKLIPIVLSNLPHNLGIGNIKPRFSKTIGERYLSNGCAHCDALMGEFYVSAENCMARELHNFPIRITSQWKRAIESNYSYGERWAVYPLTTARAVSNAAS